LHVEINWIKSYFKKDSRAFNLSPDRIYHMAIRTICPSCRAVFSLADHLAGKTVRCNKCDEAIVVPVTKGRADQDTDDTEFNDGGRAKIQTRPQSPRRPPARSEEGTGRSRRRDRDEDTEPRRRRSGGNRGLLIGLGVGCAVLALLGGGVTLAVVLWFAKHPSGNPMSDLLVDVSGPWPEPGLRAPPDRVVTVRVAGVGDEYTRDAAYDKLEALISGGGGYAMASSSNGDRMTVKLSPVSDVQAFSQKLDFGTVRSVQGRVITVVARKVEGPPPNADSVAKASTHNEAIEAIGVWGDKDSVAVLLKAMQDKETRGAAMRALGRLKDERAAGPIAERLAEFFDRHEAAEALKRMGPIAEKAVLNCLNHPDKQVRMEACSILGAIGTRQSLPALEKAAKSKDFLVSVHAKRAIEAINARQ
jgi:predicted Zn finger-like uncharacterized protein